ncbi:MAG: DUF4834 family protein [Chitinophagaceae bacterium]|nr:DUF4834 family protein [Chitinophagaceae bacterium]
MFKLLIWAILIYCLVRFIFNFVIPVARTASQMKRQMRDFQDKMNGGNTYGNNNPYDNTGNTDKSYSTASQTQSAKKPSADDYIEFEEVK